MSYLRHHILLDSPGCEASPGLYVSGRREPAMDSLGLGPSVLQGKGRRWEDHTDSTWRWVDPDL